MWHGWYWRPICIGVVLGCCLLPHAALQGAEWSAELDVRVGGEFNDNLTLTPQSHSSVWGARIKPNLQLQYATEIIQVLSGGSFEYVQYFGSDAQSLTNATLPLSIQYQGEQDRWGGSYSFVRDNTLRTELEETGIVLAFRQRNAHQVALNWERQVTERALLEAGYQFGYINYDKGEQVGLFDYQVHTGTIGGGYQFTEQFTLTGTGTYSLFDVSDANFRTQSAGIEGGLDYEVSEIWSVNISGGGRFVHAVQRGVLSETNNNFVWLVNGGVSGNWEQLQGNLAYGRTLNPSGNGRLIQTDRLTVRGTYKWTERIFVDANGMGFLTSQSGSSNGNQSIRSSKFFQVGPAVRWRATEYSTVSLGYQFSRRKSRGVKFVNGNAVSLFFTYQIGRLSISR